MQTQSVFLIYLGTSGKSIDVFRIFLGLNIWRNIMSSTLAKSHENVTLFLLLFFPISLPLLPTLVSMKKVFPAPLLQVVCVILGGQNAHTQLPFLRR